MLGLIGRNGSGQSTLLKILSRVTLPTRGEFQFTGKMSSLLEVGTGFSPELTGRENIYFNGAILGMKQGEINRKFGEIVDFSEIGNFIDTPVKHYSSGMYMGLAFAVAAHLNTEIMLIDEVLSVGDERFQKKCLQKIKDLTGSQKRTVIFVSHNLDAVKTLCPRTILLDKGLTILDGPTNQVIKKYHNLCP